MTEAERRRLAMQDMMQRDPNYGESGVVPTRGYGQPMLDAALGGAQMLIGQPDPMMGRGMRGLGRAVQGAGLYNIGSGAYGAADRYRNGPGGHDSDIRRRMMELGILDGGRDGDVRPLWDER